MKALGYLETLKIVKKYIGLNYNSSPFFFNFIYLQ